MIAGNGASHAFIYKNANFTDADINGSTSNNSYSNGINASGLVVGSSYLDRLVFPDAVLISGTNDWSLTATKLKPGKNVISIIAHGYGGDSAPLSVTIIRG